jgi:hypothetical protein
MIVQIFIAVTELIAIFLIQSKKESHRKFAPIFGLLGQPFWFYSSYEANQWGAFVLCFFFTAAWIKGLKDYWFTEQDTPLTSEQYFELITDAVEKVEQGSKLDQKDYIKRVLKEALKIR